MKTEEGFHEGDVFVRGKSVWLILSVGPSRFTGTLDSFCQDVTYMFLSPKKLIHWARLASFTAWSTSATLIRTGR